MKPTLYSLLTGIALGALSLTAGAQGANATPGTGGIGTSDSWVEPRMTPAQYEAARVRCNALRLGAREACLNDVRAAYAGEPVPDESMSPGQGPVLENQGAD